MRIESRIKKIEQQVKLYVQKEESHIDLMTPEERRDRINFLMNKMVEGLDIAGIQKLYIEYQAKCPIIADKIKELYGKNFK